MIALKLGRRQAYFYQHLCISSAKHSGVFFGIAGLNPFERTSWATWGPGVSIFTQYYFYMEPPSTRSPKG